jgi:hypothetical protein
MATATLTFNLDHEDHDHLLAVHRWDLYAALDEINQLCRQVVKHGPGPDLTLERLAERIRSIANETMSRIDD